MNNSRFRSFANIVKGKHSEPKMKEEKAKIEAAKKEKKQCKISASQCNVVYLIFSMM